MSVLSYSYAREHKEQLEGVCKRIAGQFFGPNHESVYLPYVRYMTINMNDTPDLTIIEYLQYSLQFRHRSYMMSANKNKDLLLQFLFDPNARSYPHFQAIEQLYAITLQIQRGAVAYTQ